MKATGIVRRIDVRGIITQNNYIAKARGFPLAFLYRAPSGARF